MKINIKYHHVSLLIALSLSVFINLVVECEESFGKEGQFEESKMKTNDNSCECISYKAIIRIINNFSSKTSYVDVEREMGIKFSKSDTTGIGEEYSFLSSKENIKFTHSQNGSVLTVYFLEKKNNSYFDLVRKNFIENKWSEDDQSNLASIVKYYSKGNVGVNLFVYKSADGYVMHKISITEVN